VSGTTRSPSLPEVPTMAEAGLPGYSVSGWFGVMGVAGTPQPILERLNEAVVKTVAMPDVRERLLETGYRFRYPELEEALRHVLGRPA